MALYHNGIILHCLAGDPALAELALGVRLLRRVEVALLDKGLYIYIYINNNNNSTVVTIIIILIMILIIIMSWTNRKEHSFADPVLTFIGCRHLPGTSCSLCIQGDICSTYQLIRICTRFQQLHSSAFQGGGLGIEVHGLNCFLAPDLVFRRLIAINSY